MNMAIESWLRLADGVRLINDLLSECPGIINRFHPVPHSSAATISHPEKTSARHLSVV